MPVMLLILTGPFFTLKFFFSHPISKEINGFEYLCQLCLTFANKTCKIFHFVFTLRKDTSRSNRHKGRNTEKANNKRISSSHRPQRLRKNVKTPWKAIPSTNNKHRQKNFQEMRISKKKNIELSLRLFRKKFYSHGPPGYSNKINTKATMKELPKYSLTGQVASDQKKTEFINYAFIVLQSSSENTFQSDDVIAVSYIKNSQQMSCYCSFLQLNSIQRLCNQRFNVRHVVKKVIRQYNETSIRPTQVMEDSLFFGALQRSYSAKHNWRRLLTYLVSEQEGKENTNCSKSN
ncbi:CLUMA_CG015933, isoform A [Clunio marinus]|uniref:CLUMA_CG015933, isoform A n=1 Tax=Clunio marinus TaxID=568069 RepID=A0A1J1IR15_9DIPT|nr:CLUMA_CG015933, isoform A [Clunio marinus]